MIILTLVVLAVLLLATPGLVVAKQGAPRFFSLTGEITDLDSEEPYDYLEVKVLEGNPLVTQHIDIGETLEVQVTVSTEYWRCTGTGRVDLEYNDLEEDDEVYIHGTVSGDDFIADRVVVDKPEE